MSEYKQAAPQQITPVDEGETEWEDEDEEYRKLLESKIAEAEKAGKEPFSAEAFDRYYTRFDLSDSSTKIANNPRRIRNELGGYYLVFPKVMTVKEYAEKLMERDSYGGN